MLRIRFKVNLKSIDESMSQSDRIEAAIRVYYGDDCNVLVGHRLKCAMSVVTGFRPNRREAAALLGHDRNQASKVEFASSMQRYLDSLDERDSLRQLFQLFDTESKGFITFHDLERLCSESMPHLSSSTLSEVFIEADGFGTGRLSLQQFEHFILGQGLS